jgi:hypothetical protein
LQLDHRFRFALYAAFSVLFVTGIGWLLADRMKDSPSAGEAWQTAVAYLLMLHGGAAMVALMLLGALVPLHARPGWRSAKNRLTAIAMVAFNATLIVTSFGLYYAGSETIRPWMSDIHVALGLSLPVLLVVHVWVGRRSRRLRRGG